jgi:hypothetical protein
MEATQESRIQGHPIGDLATEPLAVDPPEMTSTRQPFLEHLRGCRGTGGFCPVCGDTCAPCLEMRLLGHELPHEGRLSQCPSCAVVVVVDEANRLTEIRADHLAAIRVCFRCGKPVRPCIHRDARLLGGSMERLQCFECEVTIETGARPC